MPEPLIHRSAQQLVLDALEDTRVVFVMGARQVGKSTLARQIAERTSRRILTFDDQATRQAAIGDPTAFIAGLDGAVVIDEVQRAPDVLLAVKDAVDRDTRPGRFLLTGSANVLDVRAIKDALTGRMERITLWPLSQAEIRASSHNLVDAAFTGAVPQLEDAPIGRDAFVDIVAAGGYPEARLRAGRRRNRWFREYLDTTLDRDLRDISDALKLQQMPRLTRLLAAQSAGLLNYQSVAHRLDLHPTTVKSYVQLLETVFLIRTLPAWRPGLGTREVHSPKVHVVDSGLLAHLLAADEERIRTDDQVTGRILESFVAMEIVRHADCAETEPRVFHYRNGRDEVDIVIEDRSGRLVAVEVKAGASLDSRSSRGLVRLRDAAGDRFQRGFVVHTGRQTLALGDRLWAIPVRALWRAGEIS